MSFSISKIRSELRTLSKGNEEYAKFNKRIVNTQKSVLGVRVPDLRKLAKKIVKNSSVKDMMNYLSKLDSHAFEQVLLFGLMIVNSTGVIEDEDLIDLVSKYLDLADSWAEVDIFASKRKRKNKNSWWNFALDCLDSEDEFVVRYGLVDIMGNYLTEEYIEDIFTKLRLIKHKGYYVKMAMAWLYATAAVNFYQQTLEEIKNSNIDLWVKKKALQKMLESRQLSLEQKEEIKKLRDKLVLKRY